MNSFGMADEFLSILLIEDNYDDAEWLEFLVADLIEHGMRFCHADTLESGLLRLQKGDINLVLLDLTLPDSTGIGTVSKIIQSSPMIPIVVLTGIEDDQLAVQALARGAQDYLIKGQIDLPALCRSISYAVARQSMQEARERLAAIVESSDDAILSKTLKGTITSWNRGAEQLFGYSAIEATGQSVKLIMPAESSAELLNVLARVATGEVIHKETVRVAKNGQTVDVSETISPIRTNGQITGVAAIERDITERKRAEQELRDTEQRLSLALRAAEVGVWDLDFAANTVWRSPRHDEIFGYDELLPRWDLELLIDHVLPEDRDGARHAFKLGVEAGQLNLECRIVRHCDQALRWISVLGETYLDGQSRPIRMMGTILDITDRKAQEEHGRLRAVLNEREDFMATLTHDMKNPLIGANRVLQLFGQGKLGELSHKQRELLQSLEQANTDVLALIANLTDVYRMEQNVNWLVIEETDPAAIIASCIERVKIFAELRGVKIAARLPDEPLSLNVDPNRIERVLHNLLDNALKFVAGNGIIEVRLIRQSDRIVIEVEDNGPGIDQEEIPYLFKRFSQGKIGKRYSGGTGLGLYFCKQVAEAHGGTIECQSSNLASTIFRLCLPVTAVKLVSVEVK